MKSLKAPPKFDPETDNYEQFKKDIQIWELLTELDAKKKGPAVYLTLQNKAREAVRNLSIADISAEGGLQTIITLIDWTKCILLIRTLARMRRFRNSTSASGRVVKLSSSLSFVLRDCMEIWRGMR